MLKRNTIPAERTISGSFSCPSCGGKTVIYNEKNPGFTCRYCGAMLPDLAKIICEKDRATREILLSERNHQINLEKYREQSRIQISEEKAAHRIQSAEKRQEYRQKLKLTKIEKKAEAKRLEMEAREQQRQRQHEISMISTIAGFAITIIAILYLISRHH